MKKHQQEKRPRQNFLNKSQLFEGTNFPPRWDAKINFMKGPTSLQDGPTYHEETNFSPDGPSYCCYLASKSY